MVGWWVSFLCLEWGESRSLIRRVEDKRKRELCCESLRYGSSQCECRFELAGMLAVHAKSTLAAQCRGPMLLLLWMPNDQQDRR